MVLGVTSPTERLTIRKRSAAAGQACLLCSRALEPALTSGENSVVEARLRDVDGCQCVAFLLPRADKLHRHHAAAAWQEPMYLLSRELASHLRLAANATQLSVDRLLGERA